MASPATRIALVDVYVADEKGNVKRRMKATPKVAEQLIAFRKAEWRGRKKGLAILAVSLMAVWCVIHRQKFKAREKMTAIDSKTTQNLGRNNYRHIRSDPYSPQGLRVTQNPMDDNLWNAYEAIRAS